MTASAPFSAPLWKTGGAWRSTPTGGRTIAEWEPILALYRECGGEILTVGSDAHVPSGVGKGIREALELMAHCGFRYVCTYDKHKPVFHKL